MRVFIAWSGDLAKEVAGLLNSWLPNVIQSVDPYWSEDIEKGAIWLLEINEALATSVGILCVTRENKDAPWLLFEAGILSKGLTKARVCPLLIDLEPKDLKPPLSQFQNTLPDNADMWKLMKTINLADAKNSLEESRLKDAFTQWWPRFENACKQIRTTHKSATKPQARSPEDMIVEILQISRTIQRRLDDQKASQITGTEIPGLSAGTAALLDPYFQYSPLGKTLAAFEEQRKKGLGLNILNNPPDMETMMGVKNDPIAKLHPEQIAGIKAALSRELEDRAKIEAAMMAASKPEKQQGKKPTTGEGK